MSSASSSHAHAAGSISQQQAAQANAAVSSSSGVAVAPASSSAANSAALSAAAAVTAAASASPAAAQAAADFFFTPSTQPVVLHGSYTLTGQDCVALARTVDLLARCGFTPANDARFASLLSLWTFVHRFHANSTNSKVKQAAHNRVMEAQLSQRSGLFTRQQHLQLLMQMKCMTYIQADTEQVMSAAANPAQPLHMQSSSMPQPLFDIMRAFTKQSVVPNILVDPATQQEILRERMVLIHRQVASAAGSGQQAVQQALQSGTSISALVAQDQSIAYFQTSSLTQLSYPPNTSQLNHLPTLLGPKFFATDPCTLLSEVLVGASIHLQSHIDIPLLKQERDRMIRQQMAQRKEEIDMRLHDIRDSQSDNSRTGHARYHNPRESVTPSVKPPLWLEIDSLSLSLVELQKKVRSRVLRALPVDLLLRDGYRSRRDVEAAQRIRDKAEKKNRLATERHLKKTRRNYLAAIANHCRDFQTHHRELHKKLCKAVCAAVLKWHEDKAKRALDLEKSQEKTRLALLKENNEEAYVAMLKEAKNERLLNLLKQTDEYMDQLSRQIVQEQEDNRAKQAASNTTHYGRHQPTSDGHIPTAGELMNGDVFQSSAGRMKTSAERIDEMQEETPEEADRRRMLKREQEEQEARKQREAQANGDAAAAAAAADAANGDTPMPAADGVTLPTTAGAPPVTEDAFVMPVDVAAETSTSNYQSTRKLYYSLAHKKNETVVTQPKMLKGGTLRAYQMEGLQWLVSLYNNSLNGILADEMGLGKTVQSLSLLAYLMEVKHNYGPFLIIVPMSTLHNNWEYECDRWLPGISKVVYDGDKDRRRYLRENFIQPGHFNIVMTTFEFAMRDKTTLRKIPWAYIIIDEAHRLKNPNCKLAQELATYPKEARRVALTGTPLQNELHELWSLLNFLQPTLFGSSDTFERWFSTPFEKVPVGAQDKEKEMSMNEEEKLLVINRLHSILRPFMLRREKKHVETDLVDKIEKVLRCDLTPMQKAMYEAVLEGKVTMHNKIMQLRKIANHPILFHPYMRSQARSIPFDVDESLIHMCGKFRLLDQILLKLKRTGHRVLIFNQMTKVMDVLEQYCRMRQYTYLRLDGSTSAEERTDSLVKFNAPDSPYFLFMLSTKAGGLGLNLQSADTVILFDSDWNPMNDQQAMARSHRLGQKRQVIVLRFITTATVEEKVLMTATTKLTHEQMVIQAGMFHEKYSHNASRAIAAEAMNRDLNETGDDDAEQWTDGEISRSLARSDEELNLFLAMDAEAKRDEAAKLVSRELPEGKMPKWCFDWCVNGQFSTVNESTLIPFNDKLLDAARARVAKAHGDPLNPKARVSKAAIVEVNTDDDEDDVQAEASGVNDAAMDDDDEKPLNYDTDSEDDQPLRPQPPAAAVMPPPPPAPTPAKKSHKRGASTAPKKTAAAAAGGAAASGVKRKRDDGEMLPPSTPVQSTAISGPGGYATPAAAAATGAYPATPVSAIALASPLQAATPAAKKPRAKKEPGESTAKKSHKKKVAPVAVAAAPAHYDDDDHYTPLSYSDEEAEAPRHAVLASSGGTKLKLVMRPPSSASAAPQQQQPQQQAPAPPPPRPRVPKKPQAAPMPSHSTGPVLIKKASGTFSLAMPRPPPQQPPQQQ